MYPDSALSAGQLAIMAVVVVVSLAAWLTLVFLAARQPRAGVHLRQQRQRLEGTRMSRRRW